MRQQVIEAAESHYRRHGVMPVVSVLADEIGVSRQTVHDAYRAALDSGRWRKRGHSMETCAIVHEETAP